jgi:hypothetical protein
MQVKDKEAYQKIRTAFKTQRNGATIADIVAKTALPLNTVRELVPVASDEYSGSLEVTESGEILYSFPRGFTSKYRGFCAGLRRFMGKFVKTAQTTGKALFKVWIMVMLVGYFVLFMVIALAALLLSVAVSMSGSNNRSESRGGGGLGGLYLVSSIFNLIIRVWFYSELTASLSGQPNRRQRQKPKGQPLYKALFSFVFGDGDPNADWQTREKRSVIAYIQANQGVISLPEFMVLTGLTPEKAGSSITAYCVEFGGSPEASEDGTVVYRFDDLLLRANKDDFSASSSPIKRLWKFSSNAPKMNGMFVAINGVNLIFGSYFLFHAFNTGTITEYSQNLSYLYSFTHALASILVENPLPFLTVGLGIVPLVFSLLFWLIPALRYGFEKRDNERIKLDNLRKIGYGQIWSFPRDLKIGDITAEQKECRPKNMAQAGDRVIKEMGSYAIPEVGLDAGGDTVFTFTEIEREKDAVKKYRSTVRPEASDLGAIIELP